jgi:hypothetical protein
MLPCGERGLQLADLADGHDQQRADTDAFSDGGEWVDHDLRRWIRCWSVPVLLLALCSERAVVIGAQEVQTDSRFTLLSHLRIVYATMNRPKKRIDIQNDSDN